MKGNLWSRIISSLFAVCLGCGVMVAESTAASIDAEFVTWGSFFIIKPTNYDTTNKFRDSSSPLNVNNIEDQFEPFIAIVDLSENIISKPHDNYSLVQGNGSLSEIASNWDAGHKTLTFESSASNVTPSKYKPIPLPTSVWLLLVALIPLTLITRRSNSNAQALS